jgi:hypothetical protein
MANPVIGTLTTEVGEATTIMASATALIGGIQGRIESAVAAALANGATEAELQPLNDLVAALDTEGNALAAAVEANTPAAPPKARK